MEEDEKAKTQIKEEIEEEISRAVQGRVKDFQEQADSLTLEGVRRALEKDLGMKPLSLDVHKRFIKQCVEKFFYGANDESLTKTSEKNEGEDAEPASEASIHLEEPQSEERTNSGSGFDKKSKGSLASVEKKTTNDENNKGQGFELNEDTIRKAIKERADYFRANSETMTLSGVRRVLEEDLKLARNTLDEYKKFISKELDEVLLPPEVVEAPNSSEKSHSKKSSRSTGSLKARKGSKRAHKSSDALESGGVSSEDEEDEVVRRPKKRLARESKPGTKDGVKRKKSTEETKSSNSKKKKPVESDLDKNSETDGEHSSEDGHSHSSAEQPKKKAEKPTQAVYGKQVEYLKSIIKACGMGVPPSVYRRAKQAPESKREAYLIKELEDILEKEGLSINPSDKEIKAVKRKKERAKELEGIDMSNIVSSTRRRSGLSYIPLPKPKEESDNDQEDEEDEEDNDNGEDSDDGDDNGEGSSGASDEDGEEESDGEDESD